MKLCLKCNKENGQRKSKQSSKNSPIHFILASIVFLVAERMVVADRRMGLDSSGGMSIGMAGRMSIGITGGMNIRMTGGIGIDVTRGMKMDGSRRMLLSN